MRTIFKDNSKTFLMVFFCSVVLAVLNSYLEDNAPAMVHGISERFATYFFAPACVAVVLECLVENRRIKRTLKDKSIP